MSCIWQICKKCGRKHHFAKCCRTKPDRKVNTVSGNTSEVQGTLAATANINDYSDFYIGALGDEVDLVDYQTDKSPTEWKTELRLNRQTVTFKLHTGAEAIVLPYICRQICPGMT
ncbi:hypothetical protein HOLleu_36958 [Holothuria leucospilota]|uniref:Uncharacterized protein n=1 Tax=Holothuria leucospilota TaxID=206669 RepID=A0A9Q0YKS5_HOLLE|nr:hypothetical protein HOLleu_36958 [Holothuria leucospilota]